MQAQAPMLESTATTTTTTTAGFDSLDDGLDLRSRFVRHGDQIQIVRDLLRTFDSVLPPFEWSTVIHVVAKRTLCTEDFGSDAVPRDALARVVITVNTIGWYHRIELTRNRPSSGSRRPRD